MRDDERRRAYTWERERYGDLDIGLDFDMACRWVRLLSHELGLGRECLAFCYCTTRNSKLAGLSSAGEIEFAGKKRKAAHVTLYPPHQLRTLGHEITHAARWFLDGKSGHGDSWRADLASTHAIIRNHLPELHWCDLPGQWRPA